MARIYHVHQHIGLDHLLQRRVKCRHQLMRQIADEAHRVHGQELAAIGQPHATDCRVQCRKQQVFHKYPCAGERIQECGLAGVCVPHQRRHRHARLLPVSALDGTTLSDALHLLLQDSQPPANPLPVGFELCLPRPSRANAPTESRQLRPLPRQPGQQIAELSQLDLDLPRSALRPPGEDFQDQPGAVEHPHACGLFQIPLLTGPEVPVHQQHVGAGISTDLANLPRLSLSDEVDRVRLLAPLCHRADDLHACRLRQARELLQRLSPFIPPPLESQHQRPLLRRLYLLRGSHPSFTFSAIRDTASTILSSCRSP